MTYPKHLLVPLFSKGDILTYEFEGATLRLHLPIVPRNNNQIDRVFRGNDLTTQSTDHWEELEGIAFTEFAHQEWILEDNRTMDDIASCHMRMTLSENTEKQTIENTMLKWSNFEEYLLADLAAYYEEPSGEFNPNWPRPNNKFKSKAIQKSYLNWLQYEHCSVEGRQTSPAVFIPIDNRFILTVSFSLGALYYPDRKNPFSDEILRQVEFDLFEEFMSYIDLQYTPETIAIIEKLKIL